MTLKFCDIELDQQFPIIAAAIHNGHNFSEYLERISALTSSERLREEDPFTGEWAQIFPNKIIANFSRFEVDLNRPPDKCIYLEPEDAWGLTIWNTKPTGEIIAKLQLKYEDFYTAVETGIRHMLGQFNKIVVFDIHSYNHRREGPSKPVAEPELNPEVNIGTGTMDRDFWAAVVDRFLNDMRNYDYFGRALDVRENIKFKGGYFSRWMHENFPQQVCCLSIEFKKFFMDEWRSEPDMKQLDEIRSMLKFAANVVLKEIE
ncbi:N-formylglutamate amidohydrolase [Acidobacteriota bacterium]